jgi:imidazole glycerol-phosphate synthase subunit HisF
MNTLTQRARDLRKKQTPAEEKLWQKIKNRELGVKIVRQKPVSFSWFGGKRVFFADFYCKEAELLIEIDGSIHLEQLDYDAQRTQILNQLGFQLLRFSNDEVLYKTNDVLEKIRAMCNIAVAKVPSPPAERGGLRSRPG